MEGVDQQPSSRLAAAGAEPRLSILRLLLAVQGEQQFFRRSAISEALSQRLAGLMPNAAPRTTSSTPPAFPLPPAQKQ